MLENALSFNLSFIFETSNITRSPKRVQRSVKCCPFFHWSGCHTVNSLSHPPKKSRINVLFKMFSVIRIDKQSLNHQFCVFMLILSVQRGLLRIKCPCHTTFSHQSGTFFICFCGNTDVAVNGHYGSDGFILTMWTLAPREVVKLKLI